MDLALVAVGFGLIFFAIQVPLDQTKSRIQRILGSVVVLTGTVIFSLLLISNI
jgi:hypothetical protein